MRNKFVIGTVLASVLLAASPVEAMGNAKVEFAGSNTIKVGETFTVSMNVTDINDTYDGIVSMSGNLSFDSNMVEYISSKGIETPYLFQINEDYNYKIAGLDFTLDNGIRETLTVYEFTFKALKEGNATITLENAKLTDSQDYIDTIVLGKEITIKEKVKLPETIIINDKVEVKKVMKEEIINTVSETKKENTEIKETKVIKEERLEKDQKQETDVKKVQTIVNELVLKLKNLFK